MSVTGKLKRHVFIIAGTIFTGIGIIGIAVPVLPTTPFLLLAAICYTRGSKRLYDALMNNRLCGDYIRNYLEGRGMSLKNKIRTLSLLWISIICAAVLAADNPVVRIVLGVVLVGVTIHIVLIKDRSQEASASSRSDLRKA